MLIDVPDLLLRDKHWNNPTNAIQASTLETFIDNHCKLEEIQLEERKIIEIKRRSASTSTEIPGEASVTRNLTLVNHLDVPMPGSSISLPTAYVNYVLLYPFYISIITHGS